MSNLPLGAEEERRLSLEELAPRRGGPLGPSFLRNQLLRIWEQMGNQNKACSNGDVGGLGRRVQRWCFQQPLNHLRKERLHLSPHKTVGSSCLGVTGGVFGSLNNQTHQEQGTFFKKSLSQNVDSVCTLCSQLHCTLGEGRNKLSTSLVLHQEDTQHQFTYWLGVYIFTHILERTQIHS